MELEGIITKYGELAVQDKRITDLPELIQADSGDFIPIVDSSANITKRVSFAGLLSRIYPVGSLYFNATDGTDPASLLGFGTWVVFAAGRVPVGIDPSDTDFDIAEKTGGHKDLQSHDHEQTGSSSTANNSTATGRVLASGSGIFRAPADSTIVTMGSRTRTTGSGDSGNLQPYITVYMWKRTA